jgi:HK97 family phage prohead protease
MPKDIVKPGILTRSFGLVRSADDSGVKKLSGYAAKFNMESSTLFDRYVMDTEFVEVIRPGAFTRTLRENTDIRGLYNHDTSVVLGRTKNSTLKLFEDETGLGFEAVLPDTQAAREAWTLVDGGYIDGCSFGFSIVENRVTNTEDKIIHELLDVELYEVSIAVAFPAYEDSIVQARSRNLRRSPDISTPRLNHSRRLSAMLSAGIPIYPKEVK